MQLYIACIACISNSKAQRNPTMSGLMGVFCCLTQQTAAAPRSTNQDSARQVGQLQPAEPTFSF